MKAIVLGGNGMVGKKLIPKLKQEGYEVLSPTRQELDLDNQYMVGEYFKSVDPTSVVFLLAAKVGGIKANMNDKYHFLLDNLTIQNNVVRACLGNGIKRLIFLGSSCIYPSDYPEQPLKEEYLMRSLPESTNEGYVLAKIAGLKLIEFANKQFGTHYSALMPCNLIGWGDHFDLENCHVLPALIKKISDAKDSGKDKLVMMGSGYVRREFLNTTDLVDCLIWSVDNLPSEGFYNCGTGYDITIRELADMVKKTVGYEGTFEWDENQPNGMMRKLMDSSKLNNLGWKPKISLADSIIEEVNYYNTEVNK